MNFQVITDSAANLTPATLNEYGIAAVPYTYTFDGEEKLGCDPIHFDGKAFYDAMTAGHTVHTSQIPPQRYMDFITPYLESGRDVMVVSMSGGISGSCASACIAAAELREAFPRRRIFVLDTMGASLGEGLLAVRAAEFSRGGMDIGDAFTLMEDYRDRMYNVFTVDNLKYLRATGRLSNAAAVIGTILHIKPLLKGDENGKIVSWTKVRGRKAAVAALAEQYRKYVRNAKDQVVGIAHADCWDDAAALIDMINEIDPPKGFMTVMYEPITGSHVGPGTLALFFLSDLGVRSAENTGCAEKTQQIRTNTAPHSEPQPAYGR